jgi:very-short-patch-repair endonuclease
MQTPSGHLQNRGCFNCYGSAKRTTAEFINESVKIHGDKYNYEKTIYTNVKTKVGIYCNPCKKYFDILPGLHLDGQGCFSCRKKSTEQFIEDAIAVHGDKYGYDFSVNYVDNKTKVSIYCNSCDLHFDQVPANHLSGQGCPFCCNKTEHQVMSFLLDRYEEVTKEAIFKGLPGKRFDFYLEKYNLVIEVDGAQHFKQVSNWQSAELTQTTDKTKMNFCIENNISVIRILQEDIFHNRYDWKNTLVDAIKVYSEPTVIFIASNDSYKIYEPEYGQSKGAVTY